MGSGEERLSRRPLGYVRARQWASGSAIYLGEGASGWVSPAPEQAALVIGPPRSGKSSAVVVPSVVAAPGPVVATTTKRDIVETTAWARHQVGTCWLFDPSGGEPWMPGLRQLRWSPVPDARSWDAAVLTAHELVDVAQPSRGTTESSHWSIRAEALLAPLLHAAALEGESIAAVMQWINRHEEAPALSILESRGAPASATGDLVGIANTDERERSAIFSTAAGTLSAYRSQSALDAASAPNFDPSGFVRGCDTVYVCCPATTQDALAPLVVTLLESIRRAAYAFGRRWPPVLFALDEVANIAPLPSLPPIVSEGGSQGLVTLACLQDLSQARHRWGERAEGFASIFSAKLVMAGIGDLRTLQLVSALAGDEEHPVRSVTRSRRTRWRWPWGDQNVTTSTQRRPRLPVDAVARGQPGHALLIDGASAPAWVRLSPWYATSPWREAVCGHPGG